MPIFRTVFRFDFKLNYKILDNPGTVLEIINSISDNYFPDITQDIQSKRFSASKIGEDFARTFTVEPNAITGTIEKFNLDVASKTDTKKILHGIELKNLPKDEDFHNLNDMTATVLKKFSIDALTRAGLRVIHVSKSKNEKIHNTVKDFIAAPVTKIVAEELGPIVDSGFTLEGMHPDKIKYRYLFGPFVKDESFKYFQHVEKFKKHADFNFICDLDLSEQNFSLAGRTPIKWYLPLFERMETVIKRTEEMVGK